MLDEGDLIIDSFKLPLLVHYNHGVLGDVVAHLVKLRVYFVKVLQVQHYLFRLHLEILRELQVPYTTSRQKLAHMPLQIDHLKPENGK